MACSSWFGQLDDHVKNAVLKSYLEIRKTPDIRKPGFPKIRKSGFPHLPEIRICGFSENLDSRISGYAEIGKCWILGLICYMVFEFHLLRYCRYPEIGTRIPCKNPLHGFELNHVQFHPIFAPDYQALHSTTGLCTRLLGFAPDYWALQPTTGLCSRLLGSAAD